MWSPAASNRPAGERIALRGQIEDLLDLPLFDGVESRVAESLVAAFAACQYRAGTLLIESGDRLRKLQIIHRGIVELCRVDRDGHEFGVLLLSAKDVVLPVAAILEEPSLICARTLTTTRMLEIDADLVRSAMKTSAALTFNMMKVTSGQWRMAVRNILELTGRTAPERVGAFLLRLADLQEGAASPVLPIPKRSLASRLGITPETLSRSLQIVADHGLHLRGRAIVVRDRERIDEFCGPDLYPDRNEHPLNVFAI
jgi:CRP/FNR family transcriptional regulator, transcriptional activator FtrB